MDTIQLTISKGSPSPLGPSFKGDQINFALYSPSAKSIAFCVIEKETEKLLSTIPLLPEINKTDDIWHFSFKNLGMNLIYGFQISPEYNVKQHFLFDPYAKNLSTTHLWNKNSPNNVYNPLGEVILDSTFDWENDSPLHIPLNQLVIYEMHVRGFTKHSSSQTKNSGTFLGLIEKIPHLIELGVNAVELLPIQEFNECEYLQMYPNAKVPLCNFWGYSTVNFFAPMNRYATSANGAAVKEFKMMVKKLHQNGIEVILDMVFNHTSEGNAIGPVNSFKGIDNSTYYILDDKGNYLNYSGCGNTFNANQPVVLEMILNCLRYWIEEMHVDGFRFDLASALTRGTDGNPLDYAPIIKAITNDPIISKVKLIAEPWDSAGLYQLGHFASVTKLWSEWNDKYRDGIRRFIKGSPWTNGEFATRICGSEDLFSHCSPTSSINFITSHDGFTLADMVSYNSKHNEANGENNQDGNPDNLSWNCGIEGETDNKKILALRERQMKNFHFALMISQGVPMLTMGDEYGHTKNGNNNTWCQDNELNWFNWDKLKSKESFYRFYRLMINFRKKHAILNRRKFLTAKDIDWHGIEPFMPDWNSDMRFVAFTLKDPQHNQDLYVAFNAQEHGQLIHLPPPPYAKQWHWVVNTANNSPSDFFNDKEGPIQHESSYRLSSYSSILLKAF